MVHYDLAHANKRWALAGYTVKLQDIEDNGWHIYKLGRVTPSPEQFIWCDSEE